MDEETVRLLSLERRDIAKLSGQAFGKGTIPEHTYGSQLEGEAAIDTLTTNAVLVTTTDLSDAKKITRVVFEEGAEAFGLDDNAMSTNMAIPLHRDAESYYREKSLGGYLPELSILERLRDRWRDLFGFLRDGFLSLGVSTDTAETLARDISILVFVVLSVLINFATKYIILKALTYQVARTETKWDDFLLPKRLLNRVAYLAAGLLIYLMAIVVFEGEDRWLNIIADATLIYLTLIGTLVVNSLMTVLSDLYEELDLSREIPITGVVQMARILVAMAAGTLIISIIFNRTPVYILGSLGALTAVLLLIFKDTILGFIAGLQLSANRMVCPGDWITMPNYGADGDVLGVSLTTVRVQNFDKTIVTIPTYALMSESFQNWRRMKESGGRRIKRSVNIDMSTIQFCTEEMMERYSEIELLKEYLHRKQEELDAQKGEHSVNSRRLT